MTLLLACTLDSNNKILPLTWAIVLIEDGENWSWFLCHLKHSLFELDTEGTVIIIDQDKGLLIAIQNVLLNVNPSHCSQHLADNVQKHYGLACRNLFWGAAYVYTEYKFEESMEKIKKENQEAYDYLNKISHTFWSQYVFPAPRYSHITSNIAESINSSWDEYRKLPILCLFTATWAKVMSLMHLRHHKVHHSERITDHAKKILDQSYQEA
jgi:hypothetical protein